MAEANTSKEQLYLEENVKTIKELPHDLIRLCCSYQHLNNQFEEKFKLSQNSYQLFQNQSMYYYVLFFLYIISLHSFLFYIYHIET